MINLWQKYFANVRWLELAMSMATAFMGALIVNLQSGEKIGKEQLLKAGGVALSVGWAYLRMPKTQGESHTGETDAPLNLPPKVDPSAAVIAALVAKGLDESLARTMVSIDFEASAKYAKGSTDTP